MQRRPAGKVAAQTSKSEAIMLINLNFKELRELMSDLFDIVALEAAIKNIHATNGVDNATVLKEVTDAVNAGVTPLQSQLATQQAQIGELQKALQDTVAALQTGNTAAAQTTASAALNSVASNPGTPAALTTAASPAVNSGTPTPAAQAALAAATAPGAPVPATAETANAARVASY